LFCFYKIVVILGRVRGPALPQVVFGAMLFEKTGRILDLVLVVSFDQYDCGEFWASQKYQKGRAFGRGVAGQAPGRPLTARFSAVIRTVWTGEAYILFARFAYAFISLYAKGA